MQGMAGLRIPTKESKEICPIHHIHLRYFGKKVKPFCLKCQQEAIQKEKDEFSKDGLSSLFRAELKRSSLVDNSSEYNYTFDNFKASTGTKEANMLNASRRIAGEYYQNKNKHFNTIMYGTPGEGKTHLAMSILNAVNTYSNPAQKCLFINVNSLFLAIRNSFDDPTSRWTEEYTVKKLSDADLLVVDDLGSESAMSSHGEASNFIQRVLYQVTNRQKRIIFTTNLTMDQLKNVYNAKLVSRILEGSKGHQLDFSGISDKRY